MREYAQRDIEALGEHYLRHINAMTAKNLSSKSDIAAELAFRDATIATLTAELDAAILHRSDLLDAIADIDSLPRNNRDAVDLEQLDHHIATTVGIADRIEQEIADAQ